MNQPFSIENSLFKFFKTLDKREDQMNINRSSVNFDIKLTKKTPHKTQFHPKKRRNKRNSQLKYVPKATQ